MTEIQKSQNIRLLDVFVIGPALLWVAKTAKVSQAQFIFLITTGLATIIYNGRNYLHNLKSSE